MTTDPAQRAPVVHPVRDRLGALVDDDVVRWVGVALLVVALLVPIAYLAGRERTEDAEAAVRERVVALADALADGDSAACEMLTGEAGDQLVRAVGRKLGGDLRSCAAAVRAAASSRTPAQTQALRQVEVVAVEYREEWTTPVRDDPGRYRRSTARVVLVEGAVGLATESARTGRPDRWRIEDPGPLLDRLAPPVGAGTA